jgi:hypothetical protein
MSRLCSLAIVVVALLACSGPRAPATVAPTSVAPPPIVVSFPDDAPVVDAAAPTVDAPAPVNPHVARLRALAADPAALAAAIGPTRGLALVHYVEAPPSGRGRPDISSRHLCGAALTRALPSVQRTLGAVIEQLDNNSDTSCENHVCTVPGMEYQPAWHIHFVDVNGTLELEALAQVSEAAMSDDWLNRANAYVTRALSAARARPCSAHRR